MADNFLYLNIYEKKLSESQSITFYTVIHLFFGVVARRLNISLSNFLILHTVYELSENSNNKIKITDWFFKNINRLHKNIYKGDSRENMIFDFIFRSFRI